VLTDHWFESAEEQGVVLSRHIIVDIGSEMVNEVFCEDLEAMKRTSEIWVMKRR